MRGVAGGERVFDTGGMAEAAPTTERPALDPNLIEKIQPVNLSGQRVLPVPETLAPLFPWGGIQKGTSLSVGGNGGWSLAMAVMAEALGSEGWLAVVGVPDLGLVAASEFGVRLDRVIVVETPPLHLWPTVVAALLEAVDVVAIAPDNRVGPRDARRLTARAREQGSILLHLDHASTWPYVVDLGLEATVDRWQGLGFGHGCLQARLATVTATGRRSANRPSTLSVWLPGRDGRLAPAVPGTAVPTGTAAPAATAATLPVVLPVSA